MQDPMQQGGGGDLAGFAGQLKQLTQLASQIASSNPDVGPALEQAVRDAARQALVQKAQTAPQQNPSAMALPMGGQ